MKTRLITTLLGLASGINGLWAALLIVPICAAGLLLDGVASISLAAHRRRNLIGLWFALVAIVVLGGIRELIWTLPVVVVGRLVAGYPLRRALFDERWGFTTYAVTMLRLCLAVAGFWLLLAAAPLVAGTAGSLDWVVAPALAGVLFIWHGRNAEVFRSYGRSRSRTDRCSLAFGRWPRRAARSSRASNWLTSVAAR